MKPSRNANIKASKITRPLHFSIRFTFIGLTSLLALFHSDYYFPSGVSFFEIPHCLRGLAQLISPVDDGCRLPLLHEVAQQLQILFVQFRNIPDEFLIDEPRQQIRLESTNDTSPRFRVKSCASDSGKDADAIRS